MRLAPVLLLVVVGCESNPCDGQPPVCIAVHLSGAVPALDRLDTTTTLEDGRRLRSNTDQLRPPEIRLPVRFALLLPRDATGAVLVEIAGSSAGAPMARGSGSLRVPPSGQWLRITLGAGTPDLATSDEGAAHDGAAGDDGTAMDGAVACSAESCPDGTCYDAICCRGCWDGTTCQPGTATSGCGVNGGSCVSCESGNECKQDSCSAGACAHNDVTGSCTGGVCAGGVCHCGASGEPCCASSTTPCEGGMACSQGTCGMCGALGQPCCPTGAACASGICDQNGMCASCGGASQACCSSGLCNANLTCAGTCQCGGSGQPCCNGTTCGANLICAGGSCQCGGLGQPCCAGTTCKPGAGCCGGGGAAGVCGVETNAQLCSRYGKNCGSFTANDSCAVARTVNCGSCSCPETCQSNVCTNSSVGLGAACGCDAQCAAYPNQICNGTCCKVTGVSCQNDSDCCSGCCTTDTRKCVNGC